MTPPELYPLSLHDALPICNPLGNSCVLLAADGKTYRVGQADVGSTLRVRVTAINADGATNARSEQTDVVASNARSEEHTSELQSLAYLVCRLLLEKKKPKE